LLTVEVQLANQDLLDNFITGAPGWVDTNHFDVLAKAPPDTTSRMPPGMLRVFLEIWPLGSRYDNQSHPEALFALRGHCVLRQGQGLPPLSPHPFLR
jgi:hypothetical protein